MDHRTFTVDVPAGVEDGSTLRLADRGPAGPRGGPNGSLFVQLEVETDERFQRMGDDVHAQVHVAMVQASLGARVSIDTLDEPTDIALDAGTQSGHVIRLKGGGVPHLRGRGRGDLYVHVVVDTPTELTAKQQELLVQLAAERGEVLTSLEGTDGVFSRIRSVFG
jgi:molecular chaperone DnaJ